MKNYFDIHDTMGNLNTDLVFGDIEGTLLVYIVCANGITIMIPLKRILTF